MTDGPSWLLRRLVVAPLMPVALAVALAATVLSAVISLVAAPVLLLKGRPLRWRGPRVCAYAAVYLGCEVAVILFSLLLWIGTGAGAGMRLRLPLRLNRWVVARLLALLLRCARDVFGFRLLVTEPARHPDDVEVLRGRDPVVVLGRHAGPGASFVLIHLLTSRYGRSLRVVLKSQLRLDPMVDLLLTRTGSVWIGADPAAGTEAVAAAARRLVTDEALVLFPEGADWTPLRQLRAVARLRAKGLLAEAARAVRLPHVLPPRPGGTLAAVGGAVTSDVLVFTHTGLDDLLDTRSTWNALPLQAPLTMTWWRVPAAEIPRDSEEVVAAWLQDIWTDIDAWIGEQQLLVGLVSPPR